MKTIKINLFVILFISGIEAFSQENVCQSRTSVEVKKVNVDTAFAITTQMESLAELYNQQPSFLRSDISGLELNKAHFQNEEIHQSSHRSRWEDNLDQIDIFFQNASKYLVEDHI